MRIQFYCRHFNLFIGAAFNECVQHLFKWNYNLFSFSFNTQYRLSSFRYIFKIDERLLQMWSGTKSTNKNKEFNIRYWVHVQISGSVREKKMRNKKSQWNCQSFRSVRMREFNSNINFERKKFSIDGKNLTVETGV